jgi:anti-anti-sigma factor
MSLSTRRVLDVEDEGDATIVRFVHGRIMDEAIIMAIGQQLFSLVELGRHNVRIDFTGVDLLASAMLGKLVSMQKRLQAVGGHLVLCNLDPALQEDLATSKLDKYFRIE